MKIRKSFTVLLCLLNIGCNMKYNTVKESCETITDPKEIETLMIEKRNQPHRIEADLDGDGLAEIIEAVSDTTYLHFESENTGELETIPVYYANINIISNENSRMIGRIHIPNGILPRISTHENQIIVDHYTSISYKRRFVCFITRGKYSGMFQQMDQF